MDYPVQDILELACAAQRINSSYLKENTPIYSDDFKILSYKFSNKMMMLWTVDPDTKIWNGGGIGPEKLTVTDEDRALTNEIRSYYRRLMFGVLADPDNSFQQEVFSLLSKQEMPANKFGFIACLPSVYERDHKKTIISRTLKECENAYLSDIETTISNLEASIVDCTRSKNYDAYNITAIVNNKIVSWFSKTTIDQPTVFIQKAKVKAHQQHWISKKYETRLNYVRLK